MPPGTYPLPPATGTMHSLFLSSTRSGLHGSIFAFHSHTLSRSSGLRCLTLALLRIRTPQSSSFGCISALLTDFDLRHTILFRSFFRHILLNNTPSFAANAADAYVPARRILQRAAQNTNSHETKHANIINAAPDQPSVSPPPVIATADPVLGCGIDADSDANAAATVFDANANVYVDASAHHGGATGRFRHGHEHPAALSTGTGADNGTGIADAKLVASATATVFDADANVLVDASAQHGGATGCFRHGHEHPAALSPGTGADDETGTGDAQLVASATSERQTGVSEMNE